MHQVSTNLVGVLYLYLGLAFTLMVTLFHLHRLQEKMAEYPAALLYFALFFFFFAAIPGLIIILSGPGWPTVFSGLGLTTGNSRRGLVILAAGCPLALLAAWIGSRQPQLAGFYPYAKSICNRPGRFIFFEACYLIGYYAAWEFLYRGLLFFPLLAATNLPTALALQTIISTLHHLGHPPSEIAAALTGGIAFGLIAYGTGSFIYTFVLHALIGMGNDFFICRRRRLARSAPQG